MADVPHLLKNLKSMFVKHKHIIIPDEIVSKYNLGCNFINSDYVRQCIMVQEKLQLKLTPNLNLIKLEPTNNFDKMNVGYACDVFDFSVAAAIETLVKLVKLNKEALSTAWFIKVVRIWFDIMNGRTLDKAITPLNASAKLSEITEFKYIITQLKFSNSWKPVQTGIKLTTLSFIALVKELLSENFKFILPARFNQDCLESLFSTLRRHTNSDPNALQAMRGLRMITMSQFIDDRTEKFNYEKDNDVHIAKLIQSKPVKSTSIDQSTEICIKSYDNYDFHKDNLPENNMVEINAINMFVGGAICKTLKKNKNTCRSCKQNVVSSHSEQNNEQQSIFISCIERQNLVYPDSLFFSTILKVNTLIDIELQSCSSHTNLKDHIYFVCRKNINLSNYDCKKCNFLTSFLMFYIHLKQIALIKTTKKNVKNEKSKRFASRSTNRFSDVH